MVNSSHDVSAIFRTKVHSFCVLSVMKLLSKLQREFEFFFFFKFYDCLGFFPLLLFFVFHIFMIVANSKILETLMAFILFPAWFFFYTVHLSLSLPNLLLFHPTPSPLKKKQKKKKHTHTHTRTLRPTCSDIYIKVTELKVAE